MSRQQSNPEAAVRTEEVVQDQGTGREAVWLQAIFWVYRRVLSPVLHGISSVISPLPPGCRFQPTCSEYAYIALQRHGLLRGGAMAVWRLLHCHPFSRGGFDPVPLTVEQRQAAERQAAEEHGSSAIHTQTGSGDLP